MTRIKYQFPIYADMDDDQIAEGIELVDRYLSGMRKAQIKRKISNAPFIENEIVEARRPVPRRTYNSPYEYEWTKAKIVAVTASRYSSECFYRVVFVTKKNRWGIPEYNKRPVELRKIES
jgi:hypothetical protein